MPAFVVFLQTPPGRVLRAVIGLILIALGVFILGGAGGAVTAIVGGAIIAIFGFVLLLAGVFGFCVLAPFFGADFHGHMRAH